MNILMKKNLCVAKKFNDTISYIDDLLTVNNSKFKKDSGWLRHPMAFQHFLPVPARWKPKLTSIFPEY